MKRDIGRHSNFDDHRYWTFARNSGLPRGYFDKPKLITTDRLLVLAGLVALVWGLVG
jgi:hypothetical protein